MHGIYDPIADAVVDTHCHLGLCEPPAAELVSRARSAGVSRMLTVGLDEETNAEAVALALEHEEVLACVGRHPNSAEGFDAAAAAVIEALAAQPRVAAVGETGLDYYREGAPRSDQRRAFLAGRSLVGAGAAAGAARSRATSPIPTRASCGRRHRSCPMSCCWWRPTRRSSRPNRCADGRISPRTWSTRPRWSPRREG